MTLVTARIPELVQSLDSLSDNDKLPIWLNSIDKTRHVNLSLLRSFIITGGGTTITPVISGGTLIYIVPDTPAGTAIISIPSLAGKTFNLEINGIPFIAQQDPTIPEAEYETLSGGGFELINDLLLYGGEKLKFEIFGSTVPGPGDSTTNAFIDGKKVVNTNYTLDVANDLKKLIQIRSASTQIILTIPSVDNIPDHTVIPIEASFNNTVQNKITGTGGQYFLMNNAPYTSITIAPGEVVWLYRDDDGLHVINDFGNNYRMLAKPYAAYKQELNTLVCKGQLLLRSAYPRLWEYVQTLGFSLVDDATWNTASVTIDGRTVLLPYRGCFSSGTITSGSSANFRLPDLMGMTLTGVISESGSDPQRHLNKPGGYQDDTIKKFWTGTFADLGIFKENGLMTEIGVDNGSGPNIREKVPLDQTLFSDKNRVENIGVLWVINV